MAAFFDIVSQDPVLSQSKLVAEPWDVGQTDFYELGRFHPCGGSGTASTRHHGRFLAQQPRPRRGVRLSVRRVRLTFSPAAAGDRPRPST